MSYILKNCWELKNCGRQKGGDKTIELGECIASKEGLGHSCWAIAGTLCGGEIQGTAAQKERNCMKCEIYRLYNRTTGVHKTEIQMLYSSEEAKYFSVLKKRMEKKSPMAA